MAFIQSKSAVQTGGSGSQALAFTGNVVSGHAIIVVAGSVNAADTLTVSDGVNTYTAMTAIQNAAGNRVFRVFYCLVATGGAITVTVSGFGSSVSFVAIHEFSGLISFDTSASATGTSTASQDSGGATTANASELLFGFTAGIPASLSTLVSGTNWNQAETAITADFGFITQYQSVSSTGTYDSTTSSSVGKSGSFNWAAEIVGFKQASISALKTVFNSRVAGVVGF